MAAPENNDLKGTNKKQHNTTQHNTTQHNTTQHNTTQHNTTQHNAKDIMAPLTLGRAAGGSLSRLRLRSFRRRGPNGVEVARRSSGSPVVCAEVLLVDLFYHVAQSRELLVCVRLLLNPRVESIVRGQTKQNTKRYETEQHQNE